MDRAREAAGLARRIEALAHAASNKQDPDPTTATELLDACKVFMRDRSGIDALLTIEVCGHPHYDNEHLVLATDTNA